MPHVSWSTLLPILVIRFSYLTIRFRFMGYWALRASTACQWAGRSVIAIDWSASCKLLLRTPSKLTNNCFSATLILDLESDFRKLGSVAMLRSLVRILRTSLVQIDMEMAKKYANQRYALTSHWKRCRRMCDSINGSGDLDLWPSDLETGTLVISKVWNLHSEFGHARHSGSRVIRYERDGRTDGRKQSLLPLPYGRGIIMAAKEKHCLVSASVDLRKPHFGSSGRTARAIVTEKCKTQCPVQTRPVLCVLCKIAANSVHGVQ